ncbi:MAG: SDR family NAD(P)-dependent oxidoreductase [Caldilineaceae bacterium]|nr:SDR family NAD(P)-dependent oxidoreductase [Caldilineaceae bacterium]
MSNKSIVVTGAAKGIGFATTVHLVALGYQIFAGVRTLADGDALRAACGERVTPLLLDITDHAQIAAAVTHVHEAIGAVGLNGLVNNAGIAVAGPLEFIPLAALREQLEVNIVGQVAVTQAFLPLLRQAKGRVINISSMAGRIAGPLTGPYHASKFALEALTDSLRCELAPWGVEVVSIQPGVIATPIWETSLARAEAIIGAMPPLAHRLYGEQMARQMQRARQNNARGTPPLRVAETVAKALIAKRPRTRYCVGLDAHLVVNIIARLPDRWRDWLLLRWGG